MKKNIDGESQKNIIVTYNEPDERGILTRELRGSPALAGISCPVKSKAPFTEEEELAWENSVEQLMCRGFTQPGSISRVTGLTMQQARNFIERVQQGWEQSMSVSLVNRRREALYLEAERVKEEAWQGFNLSKETDGDPKVQGAWLKLILDASAGQARLCGLNAAAKLEVETTVVEAGIKTAEQMQMEAESKLKLPLGSLELIGSLLAEKLSQGDEDDR